jgi:N-acetylmuramoyl-L-alanine amidase CwlA
MREYNLTRYGSEIQVFEFNPAKNLSQIIKADKVRKPLKDFKHTWYRREKGLVELAKINLGSFHTPDLKSILYGWVFWDSGHQQGVFSDFYTECWLDKNNKFHVDNLKSNPKEPKWWGISLFYPLVKNGKPTFDQWNVGNNASRAAQSTSRTCLGQKADGTMILVWAKKLTGKQCQSLMIELGCIEAINADGGESAQMQKGDKHFGGNRPLGAVLVVMGKEDEKIESDNDDLSQLNYRIKHINKRPNTVPGDKMNPKYLMVHTTNNFRASANAEMHRRFLNQTSSYVSFNLVVDDIETIELVSPNLVTYHAGDGRKGHYNSQSISMEICVHNLANGKLHPSTYKNAVLTAAKMVKEHNVELVQHRDVPERSTKNCPHTDVLNYKQFCIDVEKVLKGETVQFDQSKIEWTGQLLRKGDSGTLVKDLQLSLIELGYLSGQADGVYGDMTRNAVIKLQKDAKLTTDGIAGQQTYVTLTKKLIEKKEKESKPVENYSVEIEGFNVYQDAETLKKELEKMGYSPIIKKEVN